MVNIDIRMESVNPEELIKVMEHGLPDYDGSHLNSISDKFFKNNRR